jgi:hypothetical protein
VLVKDESGKAAEAQIEAFADTWHWSHAAEEAYHELINDTGPSQMVPYTDAS